MKTMNRQYRHRTPRFQRAPVVKGLIALAFAGSISGCGSTELDALDASFGNSVNRMVEAQTRPPAHPVDPSTSQSAQSMDGKLGGQVYRQYRQSTDKPKEIKADSLEININ